MTLLGNQYNLKTVTGAETITVTAGRFAVYKWCKIIYCYAAFYFKLTGLNNDLFSFLPIDMDRVPCQPLEFGGVISYHSLPRDNVVNTLIMTQNGFRIMAFGSSYTGNSLTENAEYRVQGVLVGI